MGKKIRWCESDGNQNFTPHSINGVYGKKVYALDFDGDNDMDILTAWNNILWNENDGNENFTTHIIADSVDVHSVCAINVDGDGDIDVLSADDNKIVWNENDGNQNFTQNTITDSVDAANTIYAHDLNSDGDIDVLSAEENKITWYENDGSENFTQHTITDTVDGTNDVYAEDMDGDGDIDVLAATSDGIIWLENLSPLKIDGNTPSKVPYRFALQQNYPNPFNPTTTIEFSLPQLGFVTLKIYNILGEEVATLVSEKLMAGEYKYDWDASGLASGVYLYRMVAGDFVQVKKMILMK